MSVVQKLAGFAAALLLAFAVGYGAGGAVDPITDGPPSEPPAGGHEVHEP